MQPHPLTNFEMQKYYRNESKFNGIYSGNNVPKIKEGAYVINLNNYKSIGTHCITLCVNGNNVTYFDSFRVEYIPKEVKKFVSNKKHQNKYLQKSSKGFNNVWILLYSIY